jgi:hypothetical protein
MSAHLTEEAFADLLEDAPGPEIAEHLRLCAECRERLEEARAMMAMARSADVPEPSELYWEGFRRGVGQKFAKSRRPWARVVWPAVAALAAGLLYMALPVRQPQPPPIEARLPAWTAFPAAADDPGLEILQAVAVHLEPEAECRELDECVTDLSDEEGGALAELLRREATGRSS